MATKRSLTQRIATSQVASVYRDGHSGGFFAEVRGLYDETKGHHEWNRIGAFGTRGAAERAVAQGLGWE